MNGEATLIAGLTLAGMGGGALLAITLHDLGLMRVEDPLLPLIFLVMGVVAWWVTAREIYYGLKQLKASRGEQ